jgi:5-methylcytosine-specific restriction protein A
MINTCPVCYVSEGVSKHHIVPKSQKGKEIVLICEPCHKQIHSIFTTKQLAKNYYTIERLKENEEIQKWIAWRRTHPNSSISHKQTTKRKSFSRFA